ncbi:MAG: hypothetical protein AAF597_10160, partial [Bacteroidota bacterium]
MFHKLLFSTCLFVVLTACIDATFGASNSPTDRRIQVSEQYPNYWSWDGQEPVLLLGAGGANDAFLDPDYQQKLNILADNGGNFVSVTYHHSIHEQKLDSLVQFIRKAEELAIVVEVTLWSQPTYTANQGIKITDRLRNVVRVIRPFKNLIYRLGTQDKFAHEMVKSILPSNAV